MCSSRQVWVSLADKFSALREFLLILALLGRGLNEHAGGGSLGLAGLTNFGAGLHVDVGHILLLAENRKVRENIDG